MISVGCEYKVQAKLAHGVWVVVARVWVVVARVWVVVARVWVVGVG